MQEFFKNLRSKVHQIYITLLQRAEPVIRYIKPRYEQVREYYRTHPKAKRWTIIGSIVLGPPLFLLLVVWIEIPSYRSLRSIQNQVASEVYSADSVLLGRYYIQDRTEIKFEEISPVVMDALIATEDVRFYEHSGVDFESLGRVLVKSILLQEESAGGGSTITQQLAKNLYPRKRYWILSMLINKSRELITAQRLESIYSKKDLITLYLNTIPFADQTFGIEAASKRFFSSSAKDITVSQAAVLVGMLKATNSYNPRLFPERSLTRRNVVFAQMAKYNYLTKEKLDSLKKLPLGLKYSSISFHEGLAPYFREFVKAELMTWCRNNTKPDGSPYNIYTDGLKIYTTIDSRLQQYAEKAVAQQMTEIQKQFFDHWRKENPWQKNEEVIQDAIHRSQRYQHMKEQGMSEEEILVEMQKPVPMRVFSWEGEKVMKMSPIDSIKHHIQFLNAGFLAMDPKNGMIKAWVGGIDHDFFQYDHVKTSTKRQVGSTFKPIVYSMAIEKGFEPCDFISAERKTYIDEEGDKWTPRNTQNDYQVKYSMRGALAYSVNTVSVKLIEMAGVDSTIALSRKMGVISEMKHVPSVALGSSSVSLTEMTTAYSCIANEGVTVLPYHIIAIKDLNGKVYQDFKPANKGVRAISKETALLVRQMLQTVVHEGTASRLRWKYGVYNDVAGKTGTTQANADGWFLAMTPNLVVGTWAGADDPRIHFRNTELGQGSNTALPMYGYFMKQVNNDPHFKSISDATFSRLPYDLQQRLSCDLYELDDELLAELKVMVAQQDSIRQADTLSTLKESFMEKLYKRKMKMLRASQPSDSTANEVEGLENLGG
ncbi:MAG TPA: transglycosylase domain-containing protein [Ohtaekwangia sp.]|uniref:transglycosylase domain-containing protein n=1 Tax=Ohtaekwangia sp. TaxID=2066019 RepID=UPI002F921993